MCIKNLLTYFHKGTLFLILILMIRFIIEKDFIILANLLADEIVPIYCDISYKDIYLENVKIKFKNDDIEIITNYNNYYFEFDKIEKYIDFVQLPSKQNMKKNILISQILSIIIFLIVCFITSCLIGFLLIKQEN